MKWLDFQHGIDAGSDPNGKSFCYICKKEVCKGPEVHCKESSHLEKYALFKSNFQVNEKSISCNRCDKAPDLSWDTVTSHSSVHGIISWSKPMVVLYINSITKLNKEYQCHLCASKLVDWNAVVSHLEERKHAKLRDANKSLKFIFKKTKSLSPWMISKMVNNCVTFENAQVYKCHICSSKFSCRYDIILEHLNSEDHARNKKKRTSNDKPHDIEQNGVLEETLCVPGCYTWMIKPYNILEFSGMVQCDHCQVNAQDVSTLKKHLQQHLEYRERAEFMFKRYKSTLKHVTQEEIEAYRQTCLSVDPEKVKMTPQKSIRVVSEDLAWILEAHDIRVFWDQLYCKPCNVHLITDKAVENHLQLHKLKALANTMPGKPEQATTSKAAKDKQSQLKNAPVPCPLYLLQNNDYMFAVDSRKLQLLKFCSLLTVDNACLICFAKLPDDQVMYEHWCCHLKIFHEMNQKIAFPDWEEKITKSQLALEHISEDFYCSLCKAKVESTEAGFKEHVKCSKHFRNREQRVKAAEQVFLRVMSKHTPNWYNIEEFFCGGCNYKCFQNDVEFASHLGGQKHAKKVDGLKLMFDSCVSCGILWLGNEYMYKRHVEGEEHCEWTSHNEKTFGLSDEVVEMCLNFNKSVAEMAFTSNTVHQCEKDKESQLLQRLKTSTNHRFPRGKAYAFGSRVVRLAASDSDIDVFFDSGEKGTISFFLGRCLLIQICFADNSYFGGGSNRELMVLEDVLKCLQMKGQNSWDVLDVISNSRTPIIKVLDRPTGLRCDISFGNGLSVENTKLLKLVF